MSMRTRVLFHATVGGLLLAASVGAYAANLGCREASGRWQLQKKH